jgi:Tol biopolymer transport system component
MSRFSHRSAHRSTHRMTRPSFASIALRAILMIGSATLTACQDDAPSPVAPPPKTSAAKSGESGKPGSVEQVVFTGDKDTNSDIYIINADGTNLRRVTTDSSREEQPAFSPDNKRIVYVRASAERNLVPQGDELFTAYTDGSKRTSILKMNASLSHPRYSPDGTKIVFAAFLLDKLNSEIFVVNADGTGLKQLTYDAGDDYAPTWSPNGTAIAWVTNRTTNPAIFVMNADGLNPRPLITDCQSGCTDPAFNPGGHSLAYVDIALNVVRVFDLDHESPTIDVGPTGTPGGTESPTWTKDGSRVVFSSNRGIEGNFELYIGTPGRTDVTDVRRLTVFGPGDATTPAYSN